MRFIVDTEAKKVIRGVKIELFVQGVGGVLAFRVG